MDFCEDFHQLQIILNGVNQYIHPFDKIVFDSGNGPYIIEVVARLLKYLRVQNYLNAQNKVNKQYEPQLRRITMYLMLNTDVSFRYDLMQDSRVNHLLNSMPQLTKCLLMNCIWGLDLDRFFYEMLRYAPLWFSMQFVDQAITSLKYGKPHEVLTRIESMVCAIYFAMCRTDVDWQKEKRSEYVNHQRTLNRLCDYVGEMLRFVNTPEASKFEGWTKLRKHRYFGYVLKHMFSMTMTCLDLYFRKPAIPVDPAMAVYQLMDDVHVHKPAPVEYTQAMLGWLLKINHFMLNTLEICIMHVSLECFCYWAEINLHVEGQETVTLQQVIGESAYRLCEELNSHKHFRHSIVRHLTQFALRPKTLAQRAALLNLGALMNRIDQVESSDERAVYLNEFVHRGEQVFDNAECLGTLDEHWQLLTEDHLRAMIAYDKANPAMDDSSDEDCEPSDERVLLRELVMRAVGALPAVDFNQLLNHAINTHGPAFTWDGKQELVPAVIQLVNRLQKHNPDDGRRPSPNDASQNMQQLIFQSPELFFNTLVKSLHSLASNSNHEQLVDAIVDLLARYRTVAKCYLRTHLDRLLVTRFDVCQSPALLRFAQRLYETNLYLPHEFIGQFLLDGLGNACEQLHLPALYALLELMGRVWPACCTQPTPKEQEASDEKRHDMLRGVVKQLALISDRLRYRYPPTHVPVSQSEGQPDRMMLVWMAVKQMLPTLDQLVRELPEKVWKDFLREVSQMTHTFTCKYFLDRLECDTKMPIPFLTTEYLSCLAKPPSLATADAGETQEANVTYLLQLFTQCAREEITQLARIETFGSCMLSVNAAKLAERFTQHAPTDWVLHCVTNYVACLADVVLPAKPNRAMGRGFDTVLVLVAGLSPECVALHTEMASLYEHVKRAAPMVDVSQLMAFVMGQTIERRRKSETPEEMDLSDVADPVVESAK
uniref:Uncharacterized protein n=1 Tax=Anopheles stephensi TaxID=30069 RepID=A0A182Y7L1_ANOST